MGKKEIGEYGVPDLNALEREVAVSRGPTPHLRSSDLVTLMVNFQMGHSNMHGESSCGDYNVCGTNVDSYHKE